MPVGLIVFRKCRRILNRGILFPAVKNVFRMWIAI